MSFFGFGRLAPIGRGGPTGGVYSGLPAKPHVDAALSTSIAALVLSRSTLTLVALVAIGLAIVAVLYSIANAGKAGGAVGGRVRLDETLRGILQGQGEQMQRLERAIRALHATGKKQQTRDRGVRAERGAAPLRRVRGRRRPALVLLRAARRSGYGVVLTSINGRQETRVYAKQVTQGTSSHNLSLEEEEAIRRAMGGRQATVETG